MRGVPHSLEGVPHSLEEGVPHSLEGVPRLGCVPVARRSACLARHECASSDPPCASSVRRGSGVSPSGRRGVGHPHPHPSRSGWRGMGRPSWRWCWPGLASSLVRVSRSRPRRHARRVEPAPRVITSARAQPAACARMESDCAGASRPHTCTHGRGTHRVSLG